MAEIAALRISRVARDSESEDCCQWIFGEVAAAFCKYQCQWHAARYR